MKKNISRVLAPSSSLFGYAILGCYAFIGIGVQFGFWGQNWEYVYSITGFDPISSEHFLGTNYAGQDIWQRTLFSIKEAILLGAIVATSSSIIGALLGFISGFYSESTLDRTLLWVVASLDIIPFYLLVTAILLIFQNSIFGIYIALISSHWPHTYKTTRIHTKRLKQIDYVVHAKSQGASLTHLMKFHIIPMLASIIYVEFGLVFMLAIKAETLLSFLGLSTQNKVTWGIMLYESSVELINGHYINFLAATISLVVFIQAFNQVIENYSIANTSS